MRPYLFITFPQGFQASKTFGHLTSGSGGKNTFKAYLKSERTDKQKDTRTDILTYRKDFPFSFVILRKLCVIQKSQKCIIEEICLRVTNGRTHVGRTN